MRLSIRWRLTLWNTLALAVVLLGFSGLIYLLLRHALYEQIDRTLQTAQTRQEHGERLTDGAEIDHELREFLVVLGTAIPVALVLSGGLAYLLARKALAPIEQLHRLTTRITADRLDQRLPIINAGDELGRLAQTINDMIGRLERSFAEVRRFTADASHELRTPLTALRTEVEVALNKPADVADQANLLGSILEECERLTRLTEQLLALAREDARIAQQERKPVDLAALVRGAVETMRPLAEAKSIRLRQHGADALPMHGDAARLRQVFYNLLDNAIKYTPEGGEIEVDLGRRAGEAIVVLRDTGIGIPADHLPHVFERFYRVDKGRSRAEGGTGLGLSITHSIVTAHGGRIELDSTPGRGTVCTVILPLESDTRAMRFDDPGLFKENNP
jgi:heavy metal sensor kinase